MAECVVIGLEIIQIEQQKAQRPPVSTGLGDPLGQRAIMTAPVGQTAERVVLGDPAQQLAGQKLVELRVLMNIATDRADDQQQQVVRSEERRLGKEWVSTFRSGWW